MGSGETGISEKLLRTTNAHNGLSSALRQSIHIKVWMLSHCFLCMQCMLWEEDSRRDFISVLVN